MLLVWEYKDVAAWLSVSDCRWACAQYTDCSRAVVSCSVLHVGSLRDASSQAVFYMEELGRLRPWGHRIFTP